VVADGLRVAGTDHDLAPAARRGEVLVVDGPAGAGKSALLLTLAGRMRLPGGRIKIAGLVLPQQAAKVRRRAAVIDCARLDGLRDGLRTELAAVARGKPAVIFVDHADLLGTPDDRAALTELVDQVSGSERALVISVRDRASIEDAVHHPYRYLTLGPVSALVGANRL
jgi:putative drug exporter of the RND superfamily